MSIRTVPINSLKNHPLNTRVNNLKIIRESIRTHGFYGTIIAQESTNYILVGNHRWKAAIGEGLTTIPVHYLDVSDEKAKRILQLDNEITDEAEYNEEQLTALLTALNDGEALYGTGYTLKDLDDLSSSMMHNSGAGDSSAIEPTVNKTLTCPNCFAQIPDKKANK